MRVLGVDDEEDMLLLCRLAVERTGDEFLAAHDGLEALEMLATETEIDVVLLDMMMPRKDGISVLQDLRAGSTPQDNLPAVVMLSARAAPADQIRALREGAVDYLTKPFSPIALPDFLHTIAAMDANARQAHRAELLAGLVGEPA